MASAFRKKEQMEGIEMKKVLILGANPETVSLINKAKEMGCYTIVTDNNPNAYAKRFADQAENIDAVDVDALVDLAKREKVDGILVGVAEALLPAYCSVCERLQMPCYSTSDKFEIMARKDLFKEKCHEYGVPTTREYELAGKSDIKLPAIVKPVDSCSSKGIRVCHTREELENGIDYALAFSKAGKVLVEEYMTGDEVISYYVMQEGNPIFVGMCDRYTYKPKGNLVQLPTCYIFPSRHIDSYMANTNESVKRMIKGLGLTNGSIFFQSFVDEDGIVRVYEPGYRLNGAQEHLVISKVSGIDAKELYINLALTGKAADYNLEVFSNPKPQQFCCKLSPLIRTGKIGHIGGLSEIEKLQDVVSVNPSYADGDEVTGEGTLKQIVCRFFIVSETKERLAHIIDEIQSKLTVTDENGNSMIVGLFDTSILADRY